MISATQCCETKLPPSPHKLYVKYMDSIIYNLYKGNALYYQLK